MTDWEFGLTLTVFGMGGTLIILYLVSLMISAANKLVPLWEKRTAKISPEALAEKILPEGKKGEMAK